MAGKGGKGLLAAKTTANKDKDKKKPVSKSSRAGLQVLQLLSSVVYTEDFDSLYCFMQFHHEMLLI